MELREIVTCNSFGLFREEIEVTLRWRSRRRVAVLRPATKTGFEKTSAGAGPRFIPIFSIKTQCLGDHWAPTPKVFERRNNPELDTAPRHRQELFGAMRT